MKIIYKVLSLCLILLLELPSSAQVTTLDPQFGDQGIAFRPTEYNYRKTKFFKSVSNDKILNGEDHALKLLLYRRLSDGSPDTLFGNGGSILHNFSNGANYLQHVSEESNGSIYIFGGKYGSNAVGVVKFKENGSRDSSYGVNGQIEIPATTTTQGGGLTFISRQDANHFIIAYYVSNSSVAGNGIELMRYSMSGEADLNFGINGKTNFPDDYSRAITSLEVLEGGKIVGCGLAVSTTESLVHIFRLLPDGSPDVSFGQNGTVLFSFSGSSNSGWTKLLLLPDGKYLVQGTFDSRRSALAKFNLDGSPDPNFGTNGVAVLPDIASPTFRYISACTLQHDGKILISGTDANLQPQTYVPFILRFNPDGSIDETFVDQLPDSLFGEVSALSIQPDGKILACGAMNFGNQTPGFYTKMMMARYIPGITFAVNEEISVSSSYIYPNPATDKLKFRYSVKNNEFVTLELLGIDGKSLQILSKKEIRIKGNHEEEIDLSSLKSGFYQLVLTTGHFKQVQKFIKL